MATGCCGVKKQKLNGAVSSTKSGDRGLLSRSFGSRSTDKSNGTAAQDLDNEDGESSASASSSNYCQGMSPYPGRRQPRVICFEMVVFCFDVLYSYLHSTTPPKTPKFTNDHVPLFVTWRMGKDKKLRGCIGTFNSTSLHDGLREYAITSACKDSRFDPIHIDEFGRLHCSVSLLMDFEVADHYLDWEIGVHGIRIEFFSDKGSKKTATYLPEVAVEQGWSQIQTIDSLLRKGGFKGSITPEIRGSVCLVRFQSEKMAASYSEYSSHKKQRLNGGNSFIKHNHHYPQRTCTTILPPIGSNGDSSTIAVAELSPSSRRHTNHFQNGFHSIPTVDGTTGSYPWRNQVTTRNGRWEDTNGHQTYMPPPNM